MADPEGDLRTLQADVALLREDFQQLLADLRKVTGHCPGEICDRALASLGEALEQARAGWDDLRIQIEQRPISAMAIALTVGFAVGLACAGRRA